MLSHLNCSGVKLDGVFKLISSKDLSLSWGENPLELQFHSTVSEIPMLYEIIVRGRRKQNRSWLRERLIKQEQDAK